VLFLGISRKWPLNKDQIRVLVPFLDSLSLYQTCKAIHVAQLVFLHSPLDQMVYFFDIVKQVTL